MQQIRIPLLILVSATVSGLFIFSQEADETARPELWATSMGAHEGLSNFFKVSEDLYRGAQPEKVGFKTLKELGIKTVVNLRTFHSDDPECSQSGLNCIQITVQAWEGENEEVVDFLKAVTKPENQPVFVHCQHGADRTGVMSAVYRMAIQGWSKEDAINEMTEGGYGFHGIWKNLVTYVDELDVERIKTLAGIEK